MQATEFERQLTERGLLMSRAAEAKYAFELVRNAWLAHEARHPHDAAWLDRYRVLRAIWLSAWDRFQALEQEHAARPERRA